MKNSQIFGALVVLVLLLAAAAADPTVYLLVLTAGRVVLLAYSAQQAVQLAGGASRDLLTFLSGVGGLLYVAGILAELVGLGSVNGRDLDFLVRVVGLAFLVLPLAVAGLPRPARRALGLEGC